MLEQVTLYQVIQFILSAAGIAILLQRIPGWDGWESEFKPYIVTALNLVAAFLLPAVVAAVPAGLGEQTIDKLVIGLFMSAASFVIHYLDSLLASFAVIARLKATEWAARLAASAE
ncbi:MAG: hypothetical protein M1570_02740 [Chloroflexi bacterium]|nr:hypothetical protein [Chloroflexota bacterium]